MNAYAVRLAVTLEDRGSVETAQVEAEYYVIEDGFVTFKDVDHKLVASFPTARVVNIIRESRSATSIGSITVNVSPRLDEEAMRELMADIDRRVAAALPL